MNQISYIEIPTTDLKKSESFFEKVFGWKFESMANMPDRLVLKNPGQGAGAILFKTKSVPKKAAVLVRIEVDNIDERLSLIRKANGTSVQSKTLVPGQGWYAQFSTPDGCTFALWQTLLRAA